MQRFHNQSLKKRKLDLYAVTTSNDVYAEAFKTVIALRESGIFCEINLQSRSLKSQMRQADKKNAQLVAIFGDEELARGEVVLRNMKTSRQWNVKLTKLEEEIKKELNV